MAFWSHALDRLAGIDVIANDNGPLDYDPGEEGAIDLVGEDLEQRELSIPYASPWSGWPASWSTPDWQRVGTGVNKLADIAWQCLDLQSNIVSAMPVYQTKDSRIIAPENWMSNPDSLVYTCWQEFAKQLFWDYQMGEAFVLPFGTGSDGKPAKFRVMPPWTVSVEMRNGLREYKIGSKDVTDEILHIRYSGDVTQPRGKGPLEVAGARMTQIALLQRYANNLAETGGIPLYWMELDRRIQKGEMTDLLDNWIESRTKYAGHPAIVGSGAKLNQARTMDAKEMGLLEISQFSESRIAGLLGVPPFLVGLAGASGSLTYSNIADLFDYHDRSSLRPKTRMISESLSAWALPRGRSVEFNRDDYTRLPMDQRAQVYKTLIEIGVLTKEEVRIMERYYGSSSAQALTGGLD